MSKIYFSSFTWILIAYYGWGSLPVVVCQKVIPSHPCDRPCDNKNEPPMECHYDFKVTFWRSNVPEDCGQCPQIMEDCYKKECSLADGSRRPIFRVNNQFPGPEIRVCENDIIIVNVTNSILSGEGLTVHWHGIFHQTTPFMDGVPMITQCEIPHATTFRYKFKAYPAGTTFWHAHKALIRDDGVAGPLLIRNKDTFHGPKYPNYENDQNRVAIVADWYPARIPAYFIGEPTPYPPAILINGRSGDFETSPPSYFVFKTTGQIPYLRIVANTFLSCPITLSIEGHRLIVVSADGFPIKPIVVDVLTIFVGERFDIFLEPLNAEVGTSLALVRESGNNPFVPTLAVAFEMKWLGHGRCAVPERGYKAQSFTYLIYTPTGEIELAEAIKVMKSSSDRSIPFRDTQTLLPNAADPRIADNNSKILNPVFLPDFNTNSKYFKLTELTSYKRIHLNNQPLPPVTKTFYFFVGSFEGDRYPNINNISFAHPPSPILTQFDDIPGEMFCTLEQNPECSTQVCDCINMYKIALGDVVEIVILDEGQDASRNNIHAFHLHGNAFAVLGQEKLGNTTSLEQVKQMDKSGLLKRNLTDPIYKDTLALPTGGYGIIRFKADNPGFWLFHCHLGFHLLAGMAVLFQVGELHDYNKPPINFPRCGSWTNDFDV